MANNEYTKDFDQLDISMPGNTVAHEYAENEEVKKRGNRWYPWGRCYITGGDHVNCTNDQIQMAYQVYYPQGTGSYAGQTWCIDQTNDKTSLQSQICKQETGQENPREGSFLTYAY